MNKSKCSDGYGKPNFFHIVFCSFIIIYLASFRMIQISTIVTMFAKLIWEEKYLEYTFSISFKRTREPLLTKTFLAFEKCAENGQENFQSYKA